MRLKDVPNVVLVASGKGGVGKTTVSSDLARAASEMGYRTGLVDADISTPNSAEVLGGESVDIEDQRLSTSDSLVPAEVQGVQLVSKGLVLPDDVPVLAGAKFRAETVTDYLQNVEWDPETDLVVIDSPPGTGEEVQMVLSEVPLSDARVVTTPHPSAVRDAGKTHELFKEAEIKHKTIVNMAYQPGAEVAEHVLYSTDLTDIEGVGDELEERLRDEIPPQVSPLDMFGYDGKAAIDLESEIETVIPYTSDFAKRKNALERVVDAVLTEEVVEA